MGPFSFPIFLSSSPFTTPGGSKKYSKCCGFHRLLESSDTPLADSALHYCLDN